MSSQRFPGKVLTEIAGKPMLQYIMERIDRCTSPDLALVATSSETSDAPIQEFCRKQNFPCYLGPLQNVAKRFKEIVEREALDGFARICGDSPLLDHRLIDRAVNTFRRGNFDMVTNVLPRSYPIGQSVEVVKADAFKKSYRLMSRPDDFEHVTRYIHRNRIDYNIRNFVSTTDYSKIRLCVDSPRDMNIISSIIQLMKKPHWDYQLTDILMLYHQVCGIVKPDENR